MKFRKLPVVIDAARWFKNGDHPKDACWMVDPPSGGEPFLSEGKIVRRFRDPFLSGDSKCNECGICFHEHGWIDTREGGHRVCPGDWIICGVKGEYYPCKPDVFEATYELVTT